MKVTLLQENLKRALQNVSKNVSVKTQLPILSNILLATDNGQVKLASTNLETSIIFHIGAQIEEEGQITLPARLFSELVNSFSADKVHITLDKNNVRLVCGESEATLTGIDAAEYPPLPTRSPQKDTSLSTTILSSSLPFVAIAASSDEGRPLLTGIRFLEKGDVVQMVATDGYRLSIKQLAKIEGLGDGFVVPARALSEAVRIAVDEKAVNLDLFFSSDKNQIIVGLENATIATRLIEGDYPAFEKIIPQGFTTKVIFDKELLTKAVKFASVYAKESANVVRLSLTSNKATVSANSPQLGENKTSMDVTVEGESGDIAFNARFLLDLLNVFPEEQVLFEMNGSLSPGVFKGVKDQSFLHIIMPIRLQG